MIRLSILFIMLFLHIVDDYYLQGILASMKQKEWWQKNAPQRLYKNDYKVALIEHAFSWSFVITIPWLVMGIVQDNAVCLGLLIPMYIINTAIHALVDNAKANLHSINLVQDQSIHLFQILLTWILFMATI